MPSQVCSLAALCPSWRWLAAADGVVGRLGLVVVGGLGSVEGWPWVMQNDA
jgi:hypothetical protein